MMIPGKKTGRIYSGIRGVVPLFAETGAGKRQVGALEVGTSFSMLLKVLDKRLDRALYKAREGGRNRTKARED